MAAVLGLFGGSYPTAGEALADALGRNLDLPLLLGTWGVAHGSVDAARLCRCIRTAVQESVTATGSSVGVTAEPVSDGWTASGWEGADELRLLQKDGSLIAALAQGGDARRSSSGRDCTAWRSAEFDGDAQAGDEPLVGYTQPTPSASLPSAGDIGAKRRKQRGGGVGMFACCSNPTTAQGQQQRSGAAQDQQREPTLLTVVGSLRAAAEGPHGTSGPGIHAKPAAGSAVLRATTIGEELQSTGKVRKQQRGKAGDGAEWVEVEWTEEQPLEAGGQFAGTVTVRAAGWVLTQAEGVLFLERSVYYNARK
jgi:hypothetical protein